MMMKSVFWWRKPEHPEETTDLRQVTDETFHMRKWEQPQMLTLHSTTGLKQGYLKSLLPVGPGAAVEVRGPGRGLAMLVAG